MRYDELAARTAEAFHDRFYDERKGSYGAYGGNVFALRIGVPADRRDRVIASLRQDILSNGGRLDAGRIRHADSLETLCDNGLNELAYEAMNKRDYPSFGWWIEQGATTRTWEQWNRREFRRQSIRCSAARSCGSAGGWRV